MRKLLREGKLDDKTVEIDTAESNQSVIDVFSGTGMEEMVLNLQNMFPHNKRTKRRRVTVPEALEALTEEEAAKLIDMERVTKEAIRRAEQAGIIFIDELDKVAGRESGGHGPTSRAGVQRDLLPIVEGSTVPPQVRPAQDRPRAVRGRGRLPRLQAQGPDPRAWGPFPSGSSWRRCPTPTSSASSPSPRTR